MKRTSIVNIIAKRLRQFLPQAEFILYGSEARGDARKDSDIDILIILPEFLDKKQFISRRSEISGKIFELSLELGVEISPLILPRDIWLSRKTPFTINVLNDGIRI